MDDWIIRDKGCKNILLFRFGGKPINLQNYKGPKWKERALVYCPHFTDLAEIKFILENMHLNAHRFYHRVSHLPSCPIRQKAHCLKWYWNVVYLSYFYGDPICKYYGFCDKLPFTNKCDYELYLLMSTVVFLRPLADFNADQVSYNFYFGWLIYCLSLWPPISVTVASCPYWTIVLLAKQDITFKKDRMQLKLEPFSVSTLKRDNIMHFSDLEITAWENNRESPLLVIIILFATSVSVPPTWKPSGTSQNQPLPLGDHIHYYSSMLSNFPWKQDNSESFLMPCFVLCLY